MKLEKLKRILLNSIGNEESLIKDEETHFLYMKFVLYICKLENGMLGYCKNKQCSCRTNNIILKILGNDSLVKEIERINFIKKEDIINAINDYLDEVLINESK